MGDGQLNGKELVETSLQVRIVTLDLFSLFTLSSFCCNNVVFCFGLLLTFTSS